MRSPIDVLDEMTTEELGALLRARPDLTRPRPASLQELANRANQYPSVVQAIRGLTAFKLAVVEALCLLEPDPTIADLAASIGADADEVIIALGALREWLLAIQDGAKAHLFPAVRQAVPMPAGLGPPVRTALRTLPHPLLRQVAQNLGLDATRGSDVLAGAVEQRFLAPDGIRETLAALPPAVQELIDILGGFDDHQIAIQGGQAWMGGPPDTTLKWAQSRAVLVPASWGAMALPREIGMWIRGGRFSDVRPQPPGVLTESVSEAAVAADAGAHAQALLGHLVTLLEECEERPVATLKTGGVGVRELRRMAKRLEVEEDHAARLMEVAVAADLLGVSYQLMAVVPAVGADGWLQGCPAERWLRVAEGWVVTRRYPSLAGAVSVDGKAIPALTGHGDASAAPLRGEVLELLSRAATDEAMTPQSVSAFLHWQFPRRFDSAPAPFGHLVEWTLDEAALLGMTGRGVLCKAARHIHAGDRDAALREAAVMLPRSVTSFAVQADLTAVVAGVLEPAAASMLSDMADQESGGGATVWRFTEASVRRALDRGRTAKDLEAFLSNHAAHGVPQTLTYLIGDVARRHGHLRVSGALTVIHGNDAALIAEVVRHRKLAKLGLRLVAPTVAVTAKKPADAIAALRAAGFLPVAERGDGTVAASRPDRHRADVTLQNHGPRPQGSAKPTDSDIDELVVALRTRAQPRPEALPRPKPRPQLSVLPFEPPPNVDPALIDLLEDAMDTESAIVFGYRDAKGGEQIVMCVPTYVTNFELDATTDRGPQTFLLERIMFAELVDE